MTLMDSSARRFYLLIFLLFLISGFCGLVYQIVWIRLAFTAFGVITPLLSVVISVFMAGLAIGSWTSGCLIKNLTRRTGWSPVIFYAMAEFLIGIGAVAVPLLFSAGQTLLLPAGDFDSLTYLVLSAVILGISILPWCVFMGTTIPLGMAFIRQFDCSGKTGFSYLYLANVIGAICGTFATAGFLIELIGFSATLLLAAGCNFLIGTICLIVSLRHTASDAADISQEYPDNILPAAAGQNLVVPILFTTGFASMAMEVVWTRAFTPVLKTTVYAYAAILFVYLLATSIGSWWYRRQNREGRTISITALIILLSCFCLLPIVAGDPRLFSAQKELIVLVSIFPFCLMLGYLTPKLLDEFSQGDPKVAGRAYAVNTVGCILGPLFAGYFLLPFLGVKFSLILLAVPFVLYAAYCDRKILTFLSLAALTASTGFCLTYEDPSFYSHAVVRRDYVATVISHGAGLHKRLLVNGVGMTTLSPVTKFMAHIPLAVHKEKPQSALIICLGMGTTFRSAASWGIETTAVELVPGVRDAFGFYFDDAAEVLKKPNVKIVVDDGRRFLRRTSENFDLITIDPPPPFESSGSGLLYSEEFYRILKTRLKNNGILQQWLPTDRPDLTLNKFNIRTVAAAVCAEFPFVKVFYFNGLGCYFFASMQHFDMPTPDEFVARLPPQAAADLVEWMPDKSPAYIYEHFLEKEIPLDAIRAKGAILSITDDKPINEYFLVRRLRAKIAF